MTIFVTHCRQVKIAKLCNLHKSLRKSVFLMYSSLRPCSSDMSKRKIFVTRPDVPEAGLNMLKER
jgi:hypothetical protein